MLEGGNMNKNKLLENLEEKQFREIETELEKQITFSKEDRRNQFSKKDIVMAGGIAFSILGETNDPAEFFNFVLNILYGTLEFE
jgi:hypothetical protein